MPTADAVLLPLSVGLSLLGVLLILFSWRRGNKGRVLQGIALALAPVALYFSGLLRLLWNGVVALVRWAYSVVLSPSVWFGLSLLGLCLVLWVVGGFVARRFPGKSRAPAKAETRRSAQPAVPAGQVPARSAKPAPAEDDEMAEIEALLKARGIE